jgi:hypothetical protein
MQRFRLALDDDKLAVPRLITERRHAARAMSGVGTKETIARAGGLVGLLA